MGWPAWSPDGKQIALLHGIDDFGALALIDTATGRQAVTARNPDERLYARGDGLVQAGEIAAAVNVWRKLLGNVEIDGNLALLTRIRLVMAAAQVPDIATVDLLDTIRGIESQEIRDYLLEMLRRETGREIPALLDDAATTVTAQP
jgi:hypothetical protein